jgi:hypothetical protein
MARGQSADNLPSLSIPGWPSVRVVELPLAGEWRARSSAASRKAASLLVSRPRRTSALVTRVVLPSPGRAWGHRLSQDGPQVGHLRLRLAVLVQADWVASSGADKTAGPASPSALGPSLLPRTRYAAPTPRVALVISRSVMAHLDFFALRLHCDAPRLHFRCSEGQIQIFCRPAERRRVAEQRKSGWAPTPRRRRRNGGVACDDLRGLHLLAGMVLYSIPSCIGSSTDVSDVSVTPPLFR